MFMEPHGADWHVIELVVRNFGKTSAYDVSFTFPHPPTVAEYENATDGYADVVELQLPRQLPTLAPGQEWRTVWDSALDRTELGEGIESRFPGTVTYYDRVEIPRGWKFWQRRRRAAGDQGGARLGVAAAGAADRIDDQPRPGQAGKAEVGAAAQPADLLPLRHQGNSGRTCSAAEIERINRAVDETKDRWRTRQIEAPPTDVSLRWGNAEDELGKHRGERV